MIARHLAQAKAQWRENGRLRWSALLIVIILTSHSALLLSDHNQALEKNFDHESVLLARLRTASADAQWLDRAQDARKHLQALKESVPLVDSAGLAQAELTALLTEQTRQAGLGQVAVRAEAALEVPDRPELWQVMARVDAVVPDAGALAAYLGRMAEALPWAQIDRLEISEGSVQRMVVVVRAYYRQPVAEVLP